MNIKIKNTQEAFKNRLHKKTQGLSQRNIKDCDFILHFCPIVSRAGTDINAALDELDSFQVTKPVVLVVLHHTFEDDKVIPDSSAVVNRRGIFAVDCLFNEDAGLMTCQRNENAVDKIAQHLRSRKLTSYACLKDQDGENHSILPYKEPLWQSLLKNWKFWMCAAVAVGGFLKYYFGGHGTEAKLTQ